MGIVPKTHTFSAGATIIASEHNRNFDDIYTLVNGNLDNSNISASAAIAATKLNLATVAQGVAFTGALDLSAATITEEVTMASVNIVDGSANSLELGLVTPAPAKVTTLEATSTFKLGTTNQGDVLYDNGTSIVRLTPGTSGKYLKTQGAAANPMWDTPSLIAKSVIFTTITESGAGTNYYFPGTSEKVSGEANGKLYFPTAGTLKNLYLHTTDGDTITVTVVVNGVESSLTASRSGVTELASDTTHTATVSAGDYVSIKCVVSNVINDARVSMEFDTICTL